MAKSDAERSRQYRARKGAKTRTSLAPCGTWAAAKRHQRRGEELCEACTQAVKERNAANYQKRRGETK